jgi:methylated-DNA-[protein]-cysteine S-methyltransferase
MSKPINYKIRQMKNRKIIKPTPFGTVCIIWSVSNKIPRIDRVLLSKPGLSAECQVSELYPDSRISSCAEIDAVAAAIKAHLEGEGVLSSLDIVDFTLCSKFQQSVLRATYSIPRGSVSTYGLIAAHVGIPDGARAVGNVMACNPFPLIVPCHRVIRSDGHIGGYGGGIELKRALLEREGIIFDHAGRVAARAIHEYPSKK